MWVAKAEWNHLDCQQELFFWSVLQIWHTNPQFESVWDLRRKASAWCCLMKEDMLKRFSKEYMTCKRFMGVFHEIQVLVKLFHQHWNTERSRLCSCCGIGGNSVRLSRWLIHDLHNIFILCLFLSRCEGEDNQKFFTQWSLQLHLPATQQRGQHTVCWRSGDPLRSQPHWPQRHQATKKCRSPASLLYCIIYSILYQ